MEGLTNWGEEGQPIVEDLHLDANSIKLELLVHLCSEGVVWSANDFLAPDLLSVTYNDAAVENLALPITDLAPQVLYTHLLESYSLTNA